MRSPSAILLVHCPDRPGIVANIATFLQENGGNILDVDEHVDDRRSRFFMRVEWDLSSFGIPREKIAEFFRILVAEKYGMDWSLHFSDDRPRIAIFASRRHHCLYDMLSRWQSRGWRCEIALIISNHEETRRVADAFGVPCHVFPITTENKAQQEAEEIALIERENVELIVLARYMQVLSTEFVSRYPNRIINIHHSFLPAFPGARPYHSAHERGVKIIGATSHYVTADLDEGPIIEQDVTHVTHRDSIADLIRKGRDLEKVVLARGVFSHLTRRTIVCDNRTVVFR